MNMDWFDRRGLLKVAAVGATAWVTTVYCQQISALRTRRMHHRQWLLSLEAATMIAHLDSLEGGLEGEGVVMKVKPMDMLLVILAGWINRRLQDVIVRIRVSLVHHTLTIRPRSSRLFPALSSHTRESVMSLASP
jgi:hypothetical protein